jgi:hypothetical protein
MIKYLQRRKKKKLYQQWVERANLSPDAVPPEEVAEDGVVMPQAGEQQSQSHLTLLYILLGIAVAVVCAGLVILIVYSS